MTRDGYFRAAAKAYKEGRISPDEYDCIICNIDDYTEDDDECEKLDGLYFGIDEE